MSRVLRFNGSGFVAEGEPLEDGGSPMLADSFLAHRDMVRNFAAHRARFSEGLKLFAPELLGQLDAFYTATAAELAEETEAFPRTDVHNNSLWLRVRPVPELSDTVTATSEHLPVKLADVKGPNIFQYTWANQVHGGETLRIDERGFVLEGASSAILWWSNEENILHVIDVADRIPSTTESFITDHARERNIPTQSSHIQRDELRNHEVWAVNALQGIRVVTSVDGHALPAADQKRLSLFREAFDASWQPISTNAPLT